MRPSEELLPCPFCGSKNVKVYSYPAFSPDVSDANDYVQCADCSSDGPYGHGEIEAAAKWNTRAEQADAQAVACVIDEIEAAELDSACLYFGDRHWPDIAAARIIKKLVNHRHAAAPKATGGGVPREGCYYLADYGSVCNKCGKIHYGAPASGEAG